MKKGLTKDISGERVVIISVVVDILDILMNAAAALITGSVVMLAETLQGLSDLTSSVMVYVGLKRAKEKPTKQHPLGFGKELYFWALLASIIMFFVLSGLSFYLGAQRFLNPAPINFVFITFIVMSISIVTNSYSFRTSAKRLFNKESGKGFWERFARSDKVETKTTLILDMVGTLSTIFGMLAMLVYVITGDARFDGIGAMVIGVVMAIFAFILFLNIREFLIGRSVSQEDQKKIREIVMGFDEVVKIVEAKITSSGPERLMVYLGVNVRDDLVTDQIERLIDNIEEAIRKEFPGAEHIYIEMEAPK